MEPHTYAQVTKGFYNGNSYAESNSVEVFLIWWLWAWLSLWFLMSKALIVTELIYT